jgi:hypothetical protein
MSKRLIVAFMSFAALFALATASASAATLTQPTGTAVASGTKFKGTSIGEASFSFGSTFVTCPAVLTGTITNNIGEIEGTVETVAFKGTAANGGCTSPFEAATVTTTGGASFLGTPWCLTAGAEDILRIRGNSCANKTRAVTFALDLTFFGTSVECKYERTSTTGPIVGTYTTDTTGDAIGYISPGGSSFVPESINPFGCPGAGSLEMKFTLETDTGSIESPMYIS